MACNIKKESSFSHESGGAYTFYMRSCHGWKAEKCDIQYKYKLYQVTDHNLQDRHITYKYYYK